MSETHYTPFSGIVITGAAGFIGSTFLPMARARYPHTPIYALDALTYAGSEVNLTECLDCANDQQYAPNFCQIDITDSTALAEFFESHEIDTVINFAAETHVDRSLSRPDLFFHTNLIGTVCLLRTARDSGVRRFVQISTDEVYGSTPADVEFDETAPLNPSSPYAASKSSADLAVLSYVYSYNFPAIIVRGSNNYGPRQYPEKLIPFFIRRALEGKSLPLYGDGNNERDWIHVRDFSEGVLCALERGCLGQVYNIAGENRRTNNQIAQLLITALNSKVEVEYVADRPGHDLRYRVSVDKIRKLGFSPKIEFESALIETVAWYRDHHDRLSLLPEWERPISDTL